MQFKDIYGQQVVKDRLLRTVREGRAPHAIMFCGREGVEQFEMALAYAQYMLCSNRGETDSCGECPSCRRFASLEHPDVHFTFPTVKIDDKSGAESDDYMPEWREMVTKHLPFSQNDWINFISKAGTNKRGEIYERESAAIISAVYQKPVAGHHKVIMIWLPETMNETCANKLLKIIEEPEEGTLFVMATESLEHVLGTIVSRTQLVHMPPLGAAEVAAYLTGHVQAISAADAADAARIGNGSVVAAMEAATGKGDNTLNFEMFCSVMRLVYSRNVVEMKKWSEALASRGKKQQIAFFDYALRMVRESFISNLKLPQLNFMTAAEEAFVARFGPYVNEGNVLGIVDVVQDVVRDINQNVNAKMVFFDFTLKLARYIHKQH